MLCHFRSVTLIFLSIYWDDSAIGSRTHLFVKLCWSQNEIFLIYHMSFVMKEPVLCHMRTPAQSDHRLCCSLLRYACFSDIISCQDELSSALHCLWDFHYKVIYFISISRWREGYTPWNPVILSANKILLIISIPLWDSIKFIQHLYLHTRHMWQKSKDLSIKILRVMPHRYFKKLRVRWLYYN